MLQTDIPMTKKAKRKLKPQEVKQHFKLRQINPKTANQTKAQNAFYDDQHLVLHGCAGTGKSFLSLYLALSDVLDAVGPEKKVLVVRSCVPSRDIGFLPGSAKEKMKEYESPYVKMCSKLFGRGDAYGVLQQKGILEFHPTSFFRGDTLEHCFVIVDEIQNMTFQELDTIMTRVGENCRMLFCGDFRQTDLVKEKSGIKKFLDIISSMKEFSKIEFGVNDIVRSGVVKSYILAKQRYEDVHE